jgi:hypothetical protein
MTWRDTIITVRVNRPLKSRPREALSVWVSVASFYKERLGANFSVCRFELSKVQRWLGANFSCWCKNLLVGKHIRIQLRTLLNKNDSMIGCKFNVGASFYTIWEQRNTGTHEHCRSETSVNKTYPIKVDIAAFQETRGISIGNNIGNEGTENTFDYAKTLLGDL